MWGQARRGHRSADGRAGGSHPGRNGLLALALASCLAIPAAGNTDRPRFESEEEAAITATCTRIANKLSSVGFQECLEVALQPTGALSVEGTPILVREYPPVEERNPLGRVLLFGGIHGDEYSSVSVVFKWMDILDRNHSGLFHWMIAPLVNPDGLLRRRSQRMNARGVDLNRNFPCPDWHRQTEDYWVRRTSKNPRRYPGTAPLSEPESRWLAEEIDRFQPDVIVSVHAPHGLVDFDGPPDAPEHLGSLELKLLGTYPGSLGRYAGTIKDIPIVTLELASAGSMPSKNEQRRIWRDLVRWLRQRLEEVGEPDSGAKSFTVRAGDPSAEMRQDEDATDEDPADEASNEGTSSEDPSGQ